MNHATPISTLWVVSGELESAKAMIDQALAHINECHARTGDQRFVNAAKALKAVSKLYVTSAIDAVDTICNEQLEADPDLSVYGPPVIQ